ncbi:DUF1214 domain-containing protein [Methylorubrum extorquens]|uniref:DUF1214 domain-containing protein n=1 Tax=Methylorubrum extorquens TaxID=408 RepID=UPI002474B165|nr:DUF1214 domain-containing protein [Methylorubrum extorquens]
MNPAGYPLIQAQFAVQTNRTTSDNPINRYSVSPRDALKANPDGSVDLFIQAESPGAHHESNWLPAPSGPFVLMMRTYWPKDTLLNGSWSPPPVTRSTSASL